ncbi:MAG: substrate-binding domain-containing protein [Planctomycetaceae bacterium]
MRPVFSVALLATLLLAIGCNGNDSSTPTQSPSSPGSTDSTGTASTKYRIAVIPKGTSHDFWLSVRHGAETAAKELGNVEVIWKGTQKEGDKEGQIQILDSFIVQGVDGICLAPIDRDAMVPVVTRARDRKIPTVVFDSGLSDTTAYVSYVATDNYKGGVMAARQMGKLLDGQGDVIMLRYQAGSQSTENREKGFLETLAKEFPNINVLSQNQRATSNSNEAKLKSNSMLLKYKSELEGVFTVCEPHNKGMLAALEDNKLTSKVKFVAFDSSPRMIEGLANDTVHGVVLQDPVNMGYIAVKTMIAHLNGESVDKRISTGEYVATAQNMDEPKIASVLNPKKHAP